MITNISVKVKNYKCFQDEQGFSKIYPINIIIGKNNSGKSSLIDLIESFISSTEKEKKLLSNSECLHEVVLTTELLNQMINYTVRSNPTIIGIEDILKHNKLYVSGKEIKFRIQNHEFIYINSFPEFQDFKHAFEIVYRKYFQDKKFRRINAERDITPERYYSNSGLQYNGVNSTSIIWKYLSAKDYDQNIIKKDFLQSLNKILKPDIEFRDITIKEDSLDRRDSSEGEIYFEDINGEWIALSKMGSGVKTVILVLLNLIVIPKMENIKTEDLFLGFEELENNLHPSLQRRLFNFLSDYSEQNKSHFFITTHSNIPIDIFINKSNTQIIHVEKKGSNSFAKRIKTVIDGKNILKDLDFKASDLLLSNGIVWVEGPSDAIYLEMLLNLYSKKIKNPYSLNYCIQSLSTAIWKYAGFSDLNWDKVDNDIANKIISLAKINHNHLIILDNDGNYENLEPSKFEAFKNGTGKNKAKLINESMLFSNHYETELENNFGDTKSNSLFFWINKGTFETYLENFITEKGNTFSQYFDHNPTHGYFEKKRDGENSSKSKVELAAEIAQFVDKNNITFDDLAPKDSELSSKISRLQKTIILWNT